MNKYKYKPWFWGLAAGVLSACLMNTAAASRHEAAEQGKTVVHTAPVPQDKARTTTFKERIQAILMEGRRKTRPGGEVWRETSRVMHQLPVTSRDEGGTLLFSDSPEYVTEDGVLYRDTVQGDARVFYYHLNQTDVPKKVAVVLDNAYDGLTTVRITKGGCGAPDEDYLKVGRTVQMQYFARDMSEVIVLPRGMGRLLRPQMNEILLQPGQLVAGMYDFHADHPVTVSVLMLPADGDPVTASRSLPVLPKDAMRLRGTFAGMNRVVTAAKTYCTDEDGIMYFPLADNLTDKYREGIDATDGSRVVNEGNYGIVYTIRVPMSGSLAAQYYLSPLGGVYAGAMQVRDGAVGPNLLPTPQSRPYFGDRTPPEPANVEWAREHGTAILARNTELTDLGLYHTSQKPCFLFSPPGASNLPVNFILMPARDSK